MVSRETNLERFSDPRLSNGAKRLQFRITHECNLRCPHCRVGDYVTDPNVEDEVTTADILAFMDKVPIKTVVIDGGEPLLPRVREKAFAIVQKCIDLDILGVVIATNGTQEIPEFNLDGPNLNVQFSVSLDGIPEDHDALRGAGTAEKAMKFMRDMMQKGYYVQCQYTIQGIPNFAKIREFINFVKKNRLVNSPVTLKYLRNAGNAIDASDGANIKMLYENTSYSKENFAKFCKAECVELETVNQCVASQGRFSSIVIDPYGNIQPCASLPHVSIGHINTYDSAALEAAQQEFFTTHTNCYVLASVPEDKLIIPGNECRNSPEFRQKFYKEV